MIVNNTILQPDDGRWALNITNGSSDVIVFNNILLSEHAFRGSISADPVALETLICDHNILADRLSADDGDSNMSLAEWTSLNGLDNASATEAPENLFVDPLANDYHLIETSPAVNEGLSSISTANAPFVDFEGNARPAEGIYDIGAFEKQAPQYVVETVHSKITWLNLQPSEIVQVYSISGQLVFEGVKSDFQPNDHSVPLLFRSKQGCGVVR